MTDKRRTRRPIPQCEDGCGNYADPFMLHDHTWSAATDGKTKMFLCIDCTDKRVKQIRGRGIDADDLKPMPINNVCRFFYYRGWAEGRESGGAL